MEFALFLGCNIPVRLKQYERSSRAILADLGVRLKDIFDFNCCGYPLRNVDLDAFVLSSARNLALAEREDLNMLVLCKCGYGTFRMAEYLMKQDASLRKRVNTVLKREGLEYTGKIQVKHLLTVLSRDVGVEVIRQRITHPYENLKVATHYGCHALRPSKVVQFDDPVNPSLFDELVEATGAESVDWSTKLECCGNPLLGTHDALALDLTNKKLRDAREAGAHYLATGCVFCQLQFDAVQKRTATERNTNHHVPSILYSQLLGLSLGIDAKSLGLDENEIDITGVARFLTKEPHRESA
jgi:heterodisulfide reductase subunit B